ncbi:MAG TPA: hypothetical protein VFV08_12975, partial [Puia sp.]|nr:hypothetical protein [Puia sp.]
MALGINEVMFKFRNSYQTSVSHMVKKNLFLPQGWFRSLLLNLDRYVLRFYAELSYGPFFNHRGLRKIHR